MRNIFEENPGSERNVYQAEAHLKSFQLFFEEAVITDIVTWTNQKFVNVKNSYTSKAVIL